MLPSASARPTPLAPPGPVYGARVSPGRWGSVSLIEAPLLMPLRVPQAYGGDGRLGDPRGLFPAEVSPRPEP